MATAHVMAEDAQRPKVMPKRRDLPARPAGPELLVRDPGTGKVHFLNATAAVVWECCDGATGFAECEERLTSRFAIAKGTDVAADINAALRDFAERGLLRS